MFTPPPSPMPFVPAEDSPSSTTSPPSLSLGLSTPEDVSGFPFPRVPTSSPKSPTTAEVGQTQLDAKKRTGKRILLLVTFLPALLILSASLRHFIRLPVIDRPPPISFMKREPQAAGVPTPTSSASIAQSSSEEATPTASAPPTVPSNAVLPTPFPQPFDLTLTSNFTTQGCEAFFSDFTQQEDFRQCRAFSFLLNASSAFLDAQRNLTLFDSILWGTCNTPRDADTCVDTMSSYLSRINTACHDDLSDGNQAALQAQIGFQSYAAMRSAACLMDPSTNTYCYMEAVAAAVPADVYFYALPLGTPVPTDTKPSCSPCVKSVLAVYAQYVDAPEGGSGAVSISSGTGNSSASVAQASPLPVLSKTYPAAARLAVNQCGGTYASVGVAQPSGARRRAVGWGIVFLGLAVCMVL